MNRIVMDCKTGIISVVDLTNAEIAEAKENTAREQSERAAAAALVKDPITKLREFLEANPDVQIAL